MFQAWWRAFSYWLSRRAVNAATPRPYHLGGRVEHTTPNAGRTPITAEQRQRVINVLRRSPQIKMNRLRLRDGGSIVYSEPTWKPNDYREGQPPLVREEVMHCRFPTCAEPAVAIWSTPAGCVCWPDPVQALCWQHGDKMQSEGPAHMICRLVEIEVKQ